MKYIKKYYRILCGWKTLKTIPPNERLYVMDINGCVGITYPTYYPFEVEKLENDEFKPFGFKGTPIFYEDGCERWDGGWMIECDLSNPNDIKKIVMWKKINKML